MMPPPVSRCIGPSARFYLPEVWTEDPARCRRVRVPESVTFAAQPELSLRLLDQAQSWGVPFATVVTDAGSCIPRRLARFG
jgi:SRSO17 transposase